MKSKEFTGESIADESNKFEYVYAYFEVLVNR
jgi:hypothetical protein